MKESATNNIIRYIWDQYSGDLSVYDNIFLEKTIKQRESSFSFKEPGEYFDYLINSPDEVKILIAALNNSFSEFFRNSLTFALLEKVIFPDLILHKAEKTRNEIRIWSAACAEGQEPYSLAIILEELKAGSSLNFTYRIFASEKSQSLLQQALKGEFSAASLNNISVKRCNQWFDRQGDIYKVKPELKENIDFSEFDLLQNDSGCPASSIYGDFDVIFCANLLFYYRSRCRKKIIDKATHCLAGGGYLVTGEAERDILYSFNYHEVIPHSAVFQLNKKNNKRV